MFAKTRPADEIVSSVVNEGKKYLSPSSDLDQPPMRMPAWNILCHNLLLKHPGARNIADNETLRAICRLPEGQKLRLEVELKTGAAPESLNGHYHPKSENWWEKGDRAVIANNKIFLDLDYKEFGELCDNGKIKSASAKLDADKIFDFTAAVFNESLRDHCPSGETTHVVRAIVQGKDYIFRTITQPLNSGTSPIQQYAIDDGRDLADYLKVPVAEMKSIDYAKSNKWKEFSNTMRGLQ
jgi:hypothetical protein